MNRFLLTCCATICSVASFAQTDVKPIVNSYTGDLYIALQTEEYTDDARVPAKVFVNASETEGKVDFSLPNFSFAGMQLGDIFLPNIALNEAEGTYTFGENPNVRFNFTTAGIIADARLDEKRSYIKGDSIVAYIPVQWIMSEDSSMPIYVLFKGIVNNNFAIENGNFNEVSFWQQSRPWDSTHGLFDWSELESNEDYWNQSKWQLDEFITPTPWCIANVTGMNGIGATLVGEPIQVNDEEAEVADFAVKLTNRPNPFMDTQIVPGYMSLGTTWATADVMNLEKTADGGAFGGIAFKGKPDAIQFDYIRSHGKATGDATANEGEETYKASTINANEPATVVAYLWKGQYAQANVPGETKFGSPNKVTMYNRDRNILGLETTTGGNVTTSDDAACVASVVKSIEGDQTGSLATMVVDLNYGEFAGSDVQPDSLNIIFSASDYFGKRSKVGAGNTLVVDNVKLLYYHSLKNVTFDGKPVAFSEGNTATLTESYDANKLSYVKVGEGATVSKSFNEETNVLTLTVKAQDVHFNPEAVTTYTIQFAPTETGINDVKTNVSAASKTIYTIDGRRANTLVKGVNIVGGKKIVK